LFYIGVSSLFLPLLWYVAAWKQGGDDFLNVVLAENFGRFFHLDNPTINYELGHENGVYYNFVTLAAGFVPWTIFFVFSLFGLKLHKPTLSAKELLKDAWMRIRSMEKVKLFSLVALVCILFFYSIPSSKRSVYLMPAYPFIALFLTQYVIYLTEYRTKVTRLFAAFLASLVTVVLIAIVLTMGGVIDPNSIVSQYTDRASTLETVRAVTAILSSATLLTNCIVTVTFATLLTVCYQMFKKINIKILYATIALTFMINIMVDGIIMLGVRKGGSARPFANMIMKTYPLNKENVYVTNNPKQYRNLYALNFYMGNMFRNFEKENPDKGYFLSGEKEMVKVMENYGDKYTFNLLSTTENQVTDINQKIVLSQFVRK
ncbi:MAG: dolichyl-phosphate-mannose--protein mannosyltransferase, partial [Tannerellaceae bacterium]